MRRWCLLLAAALALPTVLLAALPAELVPFFAAIRAKESAGQPWAIFDNTTHQSFILPSRAVAEQKAHELIAKGHNLDLGLYQINWHWQRKRPNLTLANVFDPAVNASVAEIIFAEFYAAARAIHTNVDDAIRMAVGAYNNGKVRVHNPKYVNAVYRLASLAPPYANELDAGPVAQRGVLAASRRNEVELGKDSELARWFTGAPSLAILLDLADGDVERLDADTDAPATALPAALAAVAAVVVLLLGAVLLVLSVKVLPFLAGTLGALAKRAAIAAALRLHRGIDAQTSRMGKPS